MIFSVLTLLMIISGTSALVSFIYYVVNRMRENEKRELFYRAVHFASMIIFCFAGVLYLLLRTYLSP